MHRSIDIVKKPGILLMSGAKGFDGVMIVPRRMPRIQAPSLIRPGTDSSRNGIRPGRLTTGDHVFISLSDSTDDRRHIGSDKVGEVSKPARNHRDWQLWIPSPGAIVVR